MRLRKFESKSDNKVELGGHTWTKVGTIEGKDLYLCDSIVKRMPFSDKPSNDYEESSVRKWLLGSFYSKFSRVEWAALAKTNNDPVFVLGDAHIFRNENNIPRVNGEWFTATPVFDTDDMIEYVTADNEVYVGKHYSDICGVRPAFLMENRDTKKLEKIKDAYITYKSLCNDYIDNGGDESDIEDIVRGVNKVL